MVTAALFAWSDPGRLAGMLAILHAAITEKRGDTGECDTQWTMTTSLPLLTRSTTPLLPLPALLMALAEDVRMDTQADVAYTRLLEDAARACFILLVCLDGRVRRVVFAPNALHTLTRSTAPDDATRLAFIAPAAGMVKNALGYANHLLGCAQHKNVQGMAEATHIFVRFVQDWWVPRGHMPPLPTSKNG
jgi:hypothetical protein